MKKSKIPDFKLKITPSPNASKSFDQIMNESMKQILIDILITKKALKEKYRYYQCNTIKLDEIS